MQSRLGVLIAMLCCGLCSFARTEDRRDAIVVLSNHRQAVWAQLQLRDLRARENNLDTVCLLQGDLRLIDKSAFEQLCTQIFPAAPLTGYGVRWQKLRVFIESEFRKYKIMAFVANNAEIQNKTLFFDTVRSFNGTFGLNGNVCGMSTKGRYREFRRQFWGMLLPEFEPSVDDQQNVCYDNKFFIVDVSKMQSMGISRSSVNSMMMKYPQEVFTRQESGFLQLLFWNNTSQVHVDTAIKYRRGCVLDDNDQCSW